MKESIEQGREVQMKCPYCGTENDENDIFCGECGRPIEKENGKNIRFCTWRLGIAIFAAIFVGGSIGFVFRGFYGDNQMKSDEPSAQGTVEDQDNREYSASDSQLDFQTDTDNIRQTSETGDFEKNEVVGNDMNREEDIESVTGMYILPQSDKEYITDEDIAGLSLKEINYAKNEIYARHGRKFQSEELQRYFDSQSWYEGLYEAEEFDANRSSRVLNDYEEKNAEFLRKKEYSISPEGYRLDL